jgi:hypothetical protein
MKTKTYAAIFCAAAFALSSLAAAPAEAQTPKKSAAKKVAAKKYGPVPISMAPPRARITVTRRTYLDAGTYVIPGDRKFTDYAIPPGYSPTSVIDNRAGVYIDQSPLPGPFTLPGRDNPYPWNWCVGC